MLLGLVVSLANSFLTKVDDKMLNKNAKQGMEVKENSRKSFISFLVYFRVSFTLASKLTVQVVYLLVHIEFSRSSEFGVWHSDLENNQYSPNQWINHAIFRYYFPFGSLKSVHNPFRRSKMFIFPTEKRFRFKPSVLKVIFIFFVFVCCTAVLFIFQRFSGHIYFHVL